jgi:hypothetical protein
MPSLLSALFGFELIARIKDEPWKLTHKAIEKLRQKRYPNLLS